MSPLPSPPPAHHARPGCPLGDEQSDVGRRYAGTKKQGDLAYQGCVDVEVPHKKPKGGTLTPEQREENRAGAAVRARTGAIRRMKAFKIVRQDYRLATGLFPCMASVVAGLVHRGRLVG